MKTCEFGSGQMTPRAADAGCTETASAAAATTAGTRAASAFRDFEPSITSYCLRSASFVLTRPGDLADRGFVASASGTASLRSGEVDETELVEESRARVT